MTNFHQSNAVNVVMGEFNIYSFTNGNCMVNDPCDEKDGEYKYTMCIWDESKEEPKTKCEYMSYLDELNEGDILLDCGSCDDINFFDDYNWEPPTEL